MKGVYIERIFLRIVYAISILTVLLFSGCGYVLETDFVGGKGWQCTQISGCELWLKADAISGLSNGDLVSVWVDSSGNGNQASQIGTSRPTYQTSVLNGYPVVRFDGNDSFTDIFTITNQNMTIFAVFAHDHNGSSQPSGPLWQTELNSNSGFFPRWTNNNQYLWTGAWINKTTTFTRNTWYSSMVLHGTGVSELWQNGTLNDSNLVNSVGLGGFRIGYRFNDNAYYRGDLAELVFYNRALTDSERLEVEAYLNSKYSIY